MDNDITSRALLVALSINGIPGMEIEDKEIGREVARDHAVSETAGRYLKKLLDPKKISELRELNSAVSDLRQFFYANTMPWSERGWGAVTTAHYFEFTKGISARTTAVDTAFDKLMLRFPDLEQQAKVELNGMWKQDEWPDVEKLRRRYKVRVKVRPLVDATAVKVMLGVPEEIEKIKTQVQSDLYANLTGTLLDLFGRLRTFLTGDDNTRGLISKLQEHELDAKGKQVGKSFRDSAILPLRALCEIVDKLNVMGDPTLTALNQEIRDSIANRDPQALRDNTVLRTETLTKAQELAKKLAGVESILGNVIERAA